MFFSDLVFQAIVALVWAFVGLPFSIGSSILAGALSNAIGV